MKVTMEDIARKLGVSNSTVSLALNNSPKVSKSTREKVMAAAKELGYQTNPYVAALMAARRHGKNPEQVPVIALVTATEKEEDRNKLYHVKRFIEGCTVTAQNLGIRPEIFWIGDENMSARRLNDIFINRGICGAALIPQGVWGEKLNFEWHDVATVSYGIRKLMSETDWVTADFYGNMEKTLSILLENNQERVGFAMDIPFPYAQDNRWLAAYLMAQQQQRIKKIDPWLDPAPAFESFRTWFEAAKPETIICVHPKTVIAWLKQMGLSVPEDISVVAIGTAETDGEISGIVENTRRSGKLAIEMLIDRIHRGEFSRYAEPHHLTIGGLWNRGKTLRYSS